MTELSEIHLDSPIHHHQCIVASFLGHDVRENEDIPEGATLRNFCAACGSPIDFVKLREYGKLTDVIPRLMVFDVLNDASEPVPVVYAYDDELGRTILVGDDYSLDTVEPFKGDTIDDE